MKELKGTRKKKCFRALSAALAFCLLLTYTNPLETMSVFAAGTPAEDNTLSVSDSAEPAEETEAPAVTVETAEQTETVTEETAEQTETVTAETAEQTDAVTSETAEPTVSLGIAAEQTVPVGTTAVELAPADLPQPDSADPAVQALINRIAALPDNEEYLAKEPAAEEEEAHDAWMEELHGYAGESLNIQEAYDELTEEQQSQIPPEAQDKLAAWVQTAMQIAGDSMETLEGGDCGSSVTWSYDGSGNLTISGNGAMQDFRWDGDAPWYWYRDNITSVEFSGNVTRIGDWTFVSHRNASISIIIPDSVKSIGDSAFANTKLKNVIIPAGVTSIEGNAFGDNTYLTSVTFKSSTPPTLGSWAFDTSCDSLTIHAPCSWGDNFATSDNGWSEYYSPNDGNNNNDFVIFVHGKTESFTETSATCTTPGQAEGTRCSVCKKIFSGGDTIPTNSNHIYTYSATGDTITQGCSRNGCTHTATAKISLNQTSFTYTGSPIEPTANVTCSNSWEGTKPTVEYSNNTNAGNAEAYIKVSEAKATVNFEIKKATPTVTPPTPITGMVYNAFSKALVNAGKTTAGTLQYSLDGTSYSTDIPSAADAGEYTVYYKVVGNSNYNNVAAQTIKSTIAKQTPDLTVSMSDRDYTGEPTSTAGLTVNTVGGTGEKTYYFKLSSAVDGAYTTTWPTNAGTYTLKVVLAENKNFNSKTATTTFTIRKVTPNVTAPKAITNLKYTGSSQALISEGTVSGGTLKYSTDGTNYSTTIPKGTAVQTYTVYYKVEGDGNHNGIGERSFTVEIAKADPDLTVSIEGWTYGDTANDPTINTNPGNGTLTYQYKVKDAEDTTYTTTKPTNAGTYIVKATIGETTSYNIATATKEFTIAPKALTESMITIASGSHYYNGSGITPAVTVRDGVELEKDKDYTVSYENNVEVGTNTAIVKIKGKGNYDPNTTITKYFTIVYQPFPVDKNLEQYVKITPSQMKTAGTTPTLKLHPMAATTWEKHKPPRETSPLRQKPALTEVQRLSLSKTATTSTAKSFPTIWISLIPR